MYLTHDEQSLLAGESGPSAQKAMRILETLGRIYGAEHMIPVNSVQISGVSYDNLGEAGLAWLAEMAAGGGKAQVLTTLNPAGMDINNYKTLGISDVFAANQRCVLEAFEAMGVVTTCSCTPYLFGNLPRFCGSADQGELGNRNAHSAGRRPLSDNPVDLVILHCDVEHLFECWFQTVDFVDKKHRILGHGSHNTGQVLRLFQRRSRSNFEIGAHFG